MSDLVERVAGRIASFDPDYDPDWDYTPDARAAIAEVFDWLREQYAQTPYRERTLLDLHREALGEKDGGQGDE